MKSYKKLYLEKNHKIITTSYNYDAPIKILRYIIYLRKMLDKKFNKNMPKNIYLPNENKAQVEEVRKLKEKSLTTEQKRELREKKYYFTTNWFEPHVPR